MQKPPRDLASTLMPASLCLCWAFRQTAAEQAGGIPNEEAGVKRAAIPQIVEGQAPENHKSHVCRSHVQHARDSHAELGVSGRGRGGGRRRREVLVGM